MGWLRWRIVLLRDKNNLPRLADKIMGMNRNRARCIGCRHTGRIVANPRVVCMDKDKDRDM